MPRCFSLLFCCGLLFTPVGLFAQTLAVGDSLRVMGRYDAAEDAYKAVLKGGGDDLEAELRLGALFLYQQRWSKAGDRYDDVLKRDPDNLEARYGRGIVLREKGRLRPPVKVAQELLDWRQSENAFEEVLARDSAFQDVLYQYALLEQYRNAPYRALHLGRRQVALKPEAPASNAGLFRLYRHFIAEDTREAERWLKAQTRTLGAYFAAEIARRKERYASAETAFQALLEHPDGLPRTAVYLSLARTAAAQGQDEVAEQFFWDAVDAVNTPAEAALVQEEVQYVLKAEELFDYTRCRTADDYRRFFRTAWTRRDPLPAASDNLRLREHLHRLVAVERDFEHYGHRDWWNNPDTQALLDFEAVYNRHRTFNDKGLIYLRHGEPSQKIMTIQSQSESWRYRETTGSPEMIFHFQSEAGANWRLVPVLTGAQAMEDRLEWGALYINGYRVYNDEERRRQLYVPGFVHEMREASQTSVEAGLSTDRHTWAEAVEPLEMPVLVAAFRGEGGATDVEVYFAFPMGEVAKEMPTGADRLMLEIGLAVHDLQWQPLVEHLETKALTLTENATDAVVDRFPFSVPPDSYHVALHVRPEGTDLLGAWQLDQRFPDFSSTELTLSDVLPAMQVTPAAGAGTFVRNGLRVVPNPTRHYLRNQPVYIYFEAYNLTFGADDRTSYTLAYTLTPLNKRRGLFRRRSDRPELSLRTEQSGTTTAPVEYAEIDVAKVDPGEYTLTVTVTDLLTDRIAERATRITIR